jgi:predicted transcriptional regulator
LTFQVDIRLATSAGKQLNTKVKFASQADPEVLAELRAVAEREGRQLQAVLDEALRDYLERKRSGRARPRVLEALRDSMAEHGPLYGELAK